MMTKSSSIVKDATFQKQNLANTVELYGRGKEFYFKITPISHTFTYSLIPMCVHKSTKTISPSGLSGIQSHTTRIANVKGCR